MSETDLGGFSLSLKVSDIKASREFYEKLGFEVYDDHESDNWVIMRAGHACIGLFQGMFKKNILTFNPTDVRAVQKRLKASGVELTSEANEHSEGPAHATLMDPDGNPILLDQLDPDYLPTKLR